MEYVGNRWYKCDFHLHTIASNCYNTSEGENKENTYEMWVNKVKEEGLDCIAVTDHNDYSSIDKIKKLCDKENITVFPGVEVTCDSSKIHILVLFDKSFDAESVKSFLIKIDAEGEDHLGTDKPVKEVCEVAKKMNAVVIAAHIDEFNGLCEMAPNPLKKLLDSKLLDAVQVVNSKYWNQYNKEKEKLYVAINYKYGKEISHEKIDTWKKTYNKIIEAGIPLIESSDNPFSDASSNHGLYGIGKSFTFLKMGESPSLEGIRQALLAYDTRVLLSNNKGANRNPNYWIKSLMISDTTISQSKPIHVDFNPQLNTIIGGRGSGKSSIIRVIYGTLGTNNPVTIDSIKKEQEQYFKINDREYGILTQKSAFEIELVRNDELYNLKIDGFNKKSDSIKYSLSKLDYETNTFVAIEDENYLEFFKPQIYTQKQIFEIAKQPKALMNIIDQEIEDSINQVNDKINRAHLELLDCIRQSREKYKIIDTESMLKTQKSDTEEQIKRYEQSGIDKSIKEKNKFEEQNKIIQKYLNEVNKSVEDLDLAINLFKLPDYDHSVFSDEMQKLFTETDSKINEKIKCIKILIQGIAEDAKALKTSTGYSDWKNAFSKAIGEYEKQKQNLLEEGIDVQHLDELIKRRSVLNSKLDDIVAAKEILLKLKKEIAEKERVYVALLDDRRKLRQKHVDFLLNNQDDIKIEYVEYGDELSFAKYVKNILGKDNKTIDDDLERIAEYVKSKGMCAFKDFINAIKKDEKLSIEVSSHFKKSVKELDDDSFDKLITFYPEDDLRISYKPSKGKNYLPLSTASAGQKTTAILTFILSYGTTPLLLDQPEDDLDNKLVYDLVVKRLKESKLSRQIIVVTHNANIPVNGDADYIISMDTESKYVRVKTAGSIDSDDVRKEICDIMEGTEYAFKMRAQKYHMVIK